MSLNVGTLEATLKLNTSQFESAQKSVNTHVGKIGDSFGSLLKTIGLASVAVTGVAAVIGTKLARSAIDGASSLEQQKVAFTTLLGSAEEANAAINNIIEDAKSTPFELPGLIRGNQLLIASGVSAADARIDILALGNAVAATGGNQEILDRMALNLQQIGNVGRASGIDIKQFGFAGINILGLLADSTGKTETQISEMVENGKIGYDEVTTALEKAAGAGGRFEGALLNQSKTFAGVMSNIKDTFNVTMTQIANDSGLFDAVKQAAEKVLQVMNENKEAIAEVGKALAGKLGNAIIKTVEFILNLKSNIDKLKKSFTDAMMEFDAKTGLITLVGDLFDRIKEIIDTRLWPAIQNLIKVFQEHGDGLKVVAEIIGIVLLGAIMVLIEILGTVLEIAINVFSRIIAIIDGFVDFFKDFVSIFVNLIQGDFSGAFDSLKKTAIDTFNIIKNNFGLVKDVIGGIIKGIIDFFKHLYDVLVGNSIVPDLINSIIAWFKKLPVKILGSMQELVTGVIGKVQEIYNTFTQKFEEIVSLGTTWGTNVMTNFLSGLTGGITSIYTKVEEIASGIKSRISSAIESAKNVDIPWVPGFASGVNNFSGGLAMVGEHGPELVNLPRGSDVIPTTRSGQMGGKSMNVTVNVTGNTVQNDAGLARLIRDQVVSSLNKRQEINQLFGTI